MRKYLHYIIEKISVSSVPLVMDLRGALSLNTKLNNAEKLFEHLIIGPETIVHSRNDNILYAGVHGGWLVKLTNNTIIPVSYTHLTLPTIYSV